MLIKTPVQINKTKKIKTKIKQRQNRASEIRLSGVPPIMPIKTKNNFFLPSEIRLSEVPTIMLIKTPEKIN